MNGGCWKDSISCDGDTLIVPCDLEVCCLSRFKVCADSLGNIDSVIKTGSTANHDRVGTDPDCVPVCGDDPGNSIGGPGLSGIRISISPDAAIHRGLPETPWNEARHNVPVILDGCVPAALGDESGREAVTFP